MANPDIFPLPEPLRMSQQEKDDLLATLTREYRQRLQQREAYNTQHAHYDDMFRGKVPDRQGPWPGAANLHIQMPYWLVDAINTRLVSAVWDQVPIVGGIAERDEDQEAFRRVQHLVDYDLQPKVMNGRMMCSATSKIRLIHGAAAALVTYARDEYVYRRVVPGTASEEPLLTEDGRLQTDDDGNPIMRRTEEIELATATRYDGPVLYPLEYDDVVAPTDCMNLQPLRPSNPGGADAVFVRQWEKLSLIWQKRGSFNEAGQYDGGFYPYILKGDWAEKETWLGARPAQDRSGGNAPDNARARRAAQTDGLKRGDPTQEGWRNPEYETVVAFHPWEVEGEQRECVIFFCLKPEVLLGAFLLSDRVWTDDRPLMEMHYQRVGTRYYSMGVMEICQHLSEELDTIHNMRMDVGFATNMPFFFYRASSAFDPEKITLTPWKGVPVDDINDVRFPQQQNVTTFYAQEEVQLYSLIERVMAVTDLFLGVSPTRGAAARHATGFVGTQQESLARMSEVLAQDAASMAFLFRMIYVLEMQYGPEERTLRLEGDDGPETRLTRNQLWMRGAYDLRLGANKGQFSAILRQQQAQAVMQLAQANPLIQMDPGRVWEATNFFLHSIGIPNPELFIGPRAAVGPPAAKSPGQESGEMDQFIPGKGKPAPVHPNDDDDAHLETHIEHIRSSAYLTMNSPNLEAHVKHIQLQSEQKRQKQMAMMQAQGQGAGGNGQPPAGPAGPQGLPGAGGQDRIVPQLLDVGQAGSMGDLRGALEPPDERLGGFER